MSLHIHDEALASLRARLVRHAGLELAPWFIAARVGERIDALGMTDATAYIDLVTSVRGGGELDLLVEALRVGETRFFRHKAQMAALESIVIPALAKSGGRRIRAWSAGCASGEEPTTLAILLRKYLPQHVSVAVTATDISEEALAIARRGRYRESAIVNVPDHLRDWAFERDGGDTYRVRDRISSLITYERHNLADRDFPEDFDLICCRNVLIYFSAAARERVIARLIHSLTPTGFLLVGYAESLSQVDGLDMVRTPGAVLYHKSPALPPAPPQAAPPHASAPSPAVEVHADLSARFPVVAEEAIIELRGRYDDAERLSNELGEAIAGPYRRLIIDLDGADYLCDQAASVLRRAWSAARAAGIDFSVHAERSGHRRWLRRSGLVDAP